MTTSARNRDAPTGVDRLWSPPALCRLAVVQLVVLVLLTATWIGTADAPQLPGQVAWLSAAVVALAVSASANGGWLLGIRRRYRTRAASVLARAVFHAPEATRPVAASTSSWVWVPGTRRAHRAGCLLVRGKAGTNVDRALVLAHDLDPCEVCR